MDPRERLSAKRSALEGRQRILRAVRGYFESQGFMEVETPVRVRAPGQEVHLEAVGAEGSRWLITSPEYHMKRLMGAGYPRIFQLCRCFRRGEVGPNHQPEFTMIEWYRPDEPLSAVADDCEALLRLAAVAAAAPAAPPSLIQVPPPRARASQETFDLQAKAERTTVAALLARHARVTLRGDESLDELRGLLLAAGHRVAQDVTWDDAFFQVFLDHVEPKLGRGRSTFVFDWPLPLAALARPHPDNPAVAERFEWYAGGLELANAFGELTDVAVQRARFVDEAAQRRRRGRDAYPMDEKLLAALPFMPPTAGIALGFDRLVMLVLGAPSIGDVVAFADDEV